MINAQHLGVYAVIMNQNKILLVKKSRGPYKGLLDLPGGKIEHGEGIKEAVTREVMEETGLSVVETEHNYNLSKNIEFTDDRGDVSMHHIGLIYNAKVEDYNQIQNMDKEDSLGAIWAEINKVEEKNLSPFAWKIISKINSNEETV